MTRTKVELAKLTGLSPKYSAKLCVEAGLHWPSASADEIRAVIRERAMHHGNEIVVAIGREVLTVKEWAERARVRKRTILSRCSQHGWTLHEAIERSLAAPGPWKRGAKPGRGQVVTTCVEHGGETLSIAAWAQRCLVRPVVLYDRRRARGWTWAQTIAFSLANKGAWKPGPAPARAA